MEMPANLRIALEEQLNEANYAKIMTEVQSISLRYRRLNDRNEKYFIRNRDEALAYAVTRMPATFGAVYNALNYTLDSMDSPGELSSLLDIGAGTGAATWAADAVSDLDTIICIEREEVMKKIGAEMMAWGSDQLKRARWQSLNIETDAVACQADLVIASYVINELDHNLQLKTADKLWDSTKRVLLFVEPGTPKGYQTLNRIRTRLLEQGAHILAPCTHETQCPISGEDWCHFTCRIPRSRLHRLMKGGEVPYEDEKYAYLALSKTAANLQGARVLRHPQIAKGHVRLELCLKDGLKQTTYSQKDGELYKRARKSKCGDKIDPT
ncbi:MAG TPA: small ribosomal subunit Rsm22 family protein [Bacillota bacterium]|nr:small ribosomal subunit Rsm22 family protein [Bacillota bacterium]